MFKLEVQNSFGFQNYDTISVKFFCRIRLCINRLENDSIQQFPFSKDPPDGQCITTSHAVNIFLNVCANGRCSILSQYLPCLAECLAHSSCSEDAYWNVIVASVQQQSPVVILFFFLPHVETCGKKLVV